MTKVTLENLQKNASSIYEAVVVIAKRARQINDNQKNDMEIEMSNYLEVETKENEEMGEVEIDRDALNREFKKYPKPSRAAMEEMAENKITWTYETSEDAIDEDQSKKKD